MVPVGQGRWAGRRAGFTLLEMLVVVVLIALLSGVVAVSTRPDPRRVLLMQAQRIGLLMGVACDESRMRQVPIYWEADLHGYRFIQEADDERRSFADDDVLRERAWDLSLTRLAVTDLASGMTRTLLDPQAPALRVAAAHEWVQPPWRLELGSESASVTVEFDAHGHGTVLP